MGVEITLPYARHTLTEEDLAAVAEVLRSAWLTCGPLVERFEQAVARRVGAAHAVAVSSGTAALHAAMAAVGIGPGDEVIVPALTFAATANCVVYQGASPVFADVCRDTLLVDPADVARKITPRTRAIIAVDYAGQPCDYQALRCIAGQHNLVLVADAAHSLGAADADRPVGQLADLTTLSFHPAKAITSGEGGMLVTNNACWAQRARAFRNHGFDNDLHQRNRRNTWRYGMQVLGFNYRLSDIHCALGLSQLANLDLFVAKRRAIAERYSQCFVALDGMRPLAVRPGVRHAWHLYVVRVDPRRAGVRRDELFSHMREQGIGVAVHYPPVHLHPFYRRKFGTAPGMCPVAEDAADRILSLPIFPAMTQDDVDFVLATIERAVRPCAPMAS